MYSSSIANSSADSLSLLSNYSSDTIITNSPGTGRTVGHLWEKISNWVEKKVLVVAHKQGLGLNAVKERVDNCLAQHVGNRCPWSLPSHEADIIIEKIQDDCEKIGKYASCRSSPTERMALEYIIGLVTKYPFLRYLFNDQEFGVHDKIESVRDSDPDKISYEIRERRVMASRALLCFEDNDITKLVEVFQTSQEIPLTKTVENSEKTEEDRRNALIRLLAYKKSSRNPEKTYVAVHYAAHIMTHAETCKVKHIQPTEGFISRSCSGVVDRLLETKHSEFSQEEPLQKACISLLKMILVDNAPLPKTAGHPIQNMLTLLKSPATEDMYPEARELALTLSQRNQPDEYIPPQDFPTKTAKRKRRLAKQAKAEARARAQAELEAHTQA